MDKKLQKMEKKLAAANGLQVSAGVAKKTPADKQLQRDARAIVKKSMDTAQWTSSVLSADRFVSNSSSAAPAPPIAGLFTPEEYVARQREVQEHAAAAAAAAEEQKEAAKREVSAELQRKKALREAALKKMSFDLDDEA